MDTICSCSNAGFWTGLTTFVTTLSAWQWIGTIILTGVLGAALANSIAAVRGNRG